MIITTSPGVEGHRILIVFADAGILVWGAMAAPAPGHLLGPDDAPILAAGCEGFTKLSWSGLVSTSPLTADFATVLFRVYGASAQSMRLSPSQLCCPRRDEQFDRPQRSRPAST